MILIWNANIVNEGTVYKGSVWIKGERIKNIVPYYLSMERENKDDLQNTTTVIDASDLLLLPGVIDDQVHFREPGLTHKGDIYSESHAAVAGGITSFMDMPNTLPQTITVKDLNDKFKKASQDSLSNYSFFIGATNDNFEELIQPGANRAIGVKVFMGSSSGNMLVDNPLALERIFTLSNHIIATHCESETVIQTNRAKYIRKFGKCLGISFHPKIRSAKACYISSSEAVRLAKKYCSHLHLLHLSTAREIELLTLEPLQEKRITAEVCVHHLWFSDKDYSRLGNRIKWNPSIKTFADREALRQALIDGKIDIIATDHSPHTWEEKQGGCFQAAPGAPMVQHALILMLELCRQNVFTLPLIVEKMSHAPARLFNLRDRGYIRKGYYADLVLVDPKYRWTVAKENLLYKCRWSPLEGETFSHKVVKTFVNGHLVYDDGRFDDSFRGKELCCK
ncbi:MAG: dihydroorotase [Candidatus Azobacteroides pseudotrichonymphae]|jgi:dihydroorotase|nr:dihydroorotase [Bacteroidales bacterium OttesenSCG-928-I14]GMO33414.1 MAG: dihydroorotase [Candidatus Azobacteroides pseudotrichonymphae]